MLNIEKYKKELMRGVNVCKIEEIVTEITGKKICPTGVDNCNCCKELIYEWLLSEYKEPILDDAEREYLSAVIRPFRKKVKHIAIWDTCNGSKQFVHIKLYDEDCINLPNFKPNAMYKGMELHKEYTLEELGL